MIDAALRVESAPGASRRIGLREATPRPGHLTRVRDVIYNKDTTSPLSTLPTALDDEIELQPDEDRDVGARRSGRLEGRAQPQGQYHLCQAGRKECAVEPSMSSRTDASTVSFSGRIRPPSSQIYEARFRFEDEASAGLLAARSERAANPNLKDLNIANANSDYGYKGSSANKPVAAPRRDGGRPGFASKARCRRLISSTPIATRASSTIDRRSLCRRR